MTKRNQKKERLLHIKFFYNRKGDVLYISIGSHREAISREVGDDILIRVDPKKEKVVGFTILNFTGSSINVRKERSVPDYGRS